MNDETNLQPKSALREAPTSASDAAHHPADPHSAPTAAPESAASADSTASCCHDHAEHDEAHGHCCHDHAEHDEAHGPCCHDHAEHDEEHGPCCHDHAEHEDAHDYCSHSHAEHDDAHGHAHHGHDHAHGEHHHGHHHHAVDVQNTRMRHILQISIVLNLLFVVVESLVGLTQHSLSLLSDAGHNLGDVLSLVLVLVAFRLSRAQSSSRYTYGYKKSTVLISLLNAIILLVAVGAILIESVHKLVSPTDVNGVAVSWTAGVGILINGATALLLMRGQQHDLNVRGAFLHMAADTLVSVGVVVSGLLISATGWNLIDPIVSIVIAIVILVSTWGLLSDSLRLSLDGSPEGIEADAVAHSMTALPAVKAVHHLHVWAISTTETALTAHVVVDDLERMDATKRELKALLRKQGIGHSTLEFETQDCHCAEVDCC